MERARRLAGENTLHPPRQEVRRVEAAELEAMGSVVGSTVPQRWLGQAIAHGSGVVLASTVGSRAEAVVMEVQKLLKPFGGVPFDTDGAGVYDRPLPAAVHPIGKANTLQRERKPLTLRTRIKRVARRTLCFSNRSSGTIPSLAAL
jgi:insertion element IS1 protein InsB